MLTNKGKQQVLRMLSSQSFILGQSIAVGIGTGAETDDDAKLDFEISRSLVTVVSPDFLTNSIVLKTTLPKELIGTIKEVGLWSFDADAAVGQYGSRILFSFDPDTEFWPDEAVFDTTHARVGNSTLRLTATASTTSAVTLDGFNLDLLGYSDSDDIKIALFASSNIANVKVRFGIDSSNYYEATLNPSTGYQIITKSKNDFVAVGDPSWSILSTATFSVTSTSGGAGTVDLDGIRIEDEDTFNPEYFLVSRGVLETPIIKTDHIPMDVEYAIKLEFDD